MPGLDEYKPANVIKMLLMGHSGVGKTSALLSLVQAGYQLRVWDYDNLLIPLKNLITKHCPDKIKNVQVMSFRDKIKAGPLGPIVDGTPRAMNDGQKALEKWEDGSNPGTWGPDFVAVIDSFTRLCDAAYRWGEFVTPSGKGGEKDGRAIYGEGQRAAANYLSTITSEAFHTNVIVIAHMQFHTLKEGVTKIFPRGLGQALGPDIPTYFPTWLQVENNAGKRTIRTIPTEWADLKNPVAEPVPAVLPAETGLATFFAAAKGAK